MWPSPHSATWLSSSRCPSGSRKKHLTSYPWSTGGVRNRAPLACNVSHAAWQIGDDEQVRQLRAGRELGRSGVGHGSTVMHAGLGLQTDDAEAAQGVAVRPDRRGCAAATLPLAGRRRATSVNRSPCAPPTARRSCPSGPPRSTQQAAAIDAQHAALDLVGGAGRRAEGTSRAGPDSPCLAGRRGAAVVVLGMDPPRQAGRHARNARWPLPPVVDDHHGPAQLSTQRRGVLVPDVPHVSPAPAGASTPSTRLVACRQAPVLWHFDADE